MNLKKSNIKNFIIIKLIVIILISILFYYFYYENNTLKFGTSIENKNQSEYSNISGNIENKFHVSSIANSKEIEIRYEAIDGKNISWPVKIEYKVLENGNTIKQGEYDIKEGNYRTINIKRDSSKEYNIISKIFENTGKLINDSSLKIKREEKTSKSISLEKLFQKEVEYIKNNINIIVSDFEKEATNGNWYAVDIRFIKIDDLVAKQEDGNNILNTEILIIFEDGHYSYLAKLLKNDNKYIVDGYYTFIQKPGEKVGWKNMENDKELEFGEVIHHWSIDQ